MVPINYAGEERFTFDLAPHSKVALRRYEPIPAVPAEFESVSLIEELDETKKNLRLILLSRFWIPKQHCVHQAVGE